VEVSETVDGPPEAVWRVITDWERQGDWMLEASDFVVTSALRRGVGVEAEATVRIAGITTRDKIRVVAWEPARRLAIEHLGWVSGTAELQLRGAEPATTHVVWRERLRPPLGVAGAIGLTGLRPLLQRTFERDLRVLGALTRARSSPRS
jgi:hypothetical protein